MAAIIALKDLRLYRYCRSFQNGNQRLGLILKLTDCSGNEGWGEIAPLPGFSLETLTSAITELKEKLVPIFAQKTVATHQINQALLSCYPSVQFGVETAWLDLTSPCTPPPVLTSGLIQGSKASIKTALQTNPFSTVKLKLTSFSSQEAHGIIDATLPLLKKVKVRIDANQHWTLPEALSLAKNFPQSQLDYYEEPLDCFSDIRSFPYPIAYDETARQKPLDQLGNNPHLKAIIVKPTLSGGPTQLIPIASLCRKKKIDFILSSSYESEIGIVQIAKLCYRLQLPMKPMGLDTCRYFQAPLISQPVTIRAGHLFIPKKWHINEEFINECFRMPL